MLRSAKIEKADCLLATTRYDNVNLMVAQIAREVFGVSKVVARVFDPSRQAVYVRFGIETICPTTLSSEVFMQTVAARPEADSA